MGSLYLENLVDCRIWKCLICLAPSQEQPRLRNRSAGFSLSAEYQTPQGDRFNDGLVRRVRRWSRTRPHEWMMQRPVQDLITKAMTANAA